MSKTEIVTPETTFRQIENQINRAVRHCRIGKVTEKPKLGFGLFDSKGQLWGISIPAVAAFPSFNRLGLDAYGA